MLPSHVNGFVLPKWQYKAHHHPRPSCRRYGTCRQRDAHAFEVQFFECCGGGSGVDFTLPSGDTISSVPLPAALPLIAAGLGTGFFVSKWRRSPSGEAPDARG
jgi:hypothetical protein